MLVVFKLTVYCFPKRIKKTLQANYLNSWSGRNDFELGRNDLGRNDRNSLLQPDIPTTHVRLISFHQFAFSIKEDHNGVKCFFHAAFNGIA